MQYICMRIYIYIYIYIYACAPRGRPRCEGCDCNSVNTIITNQIIYITFNITYYYHCYYD